jgi:hypothetical protein
VVPVARSEPRRARQLIPAELPHGRQAAAACAVLVLVAHVLLAQLTLVLALAFAVVTRLSRWRLSWLLVPAAAGLILTLAVGPGRAAAGFAAGPAHVLGYLGRGRLAARLAHPLGAFAGAGRWLPRQLPVALLAAAAEAALAGWLTWLRTDEWAVAPPRPGLVAAARGALNARLIGAGGVVTRAGCALGVVASTGAVAELRWSQVAGGTLVAGASAPEVTVTSLQVVHAALRRRRPLIVIDAGADASVVRAVQAACRATGTPLLPAGPDPGRVIRERGAALVTAPSPEGAARACADLAALAADLRRIGVDGDGLIWLPRGERLPVPSVAALIRAGGAVGLPVLITTASPAAAASLAAVVGTLLIHRVTDPALAASLARRTGTRLRPATAGVTAAAAMTEPVPVWAGGSASLQTLTGTAMPEAMTGSTAPGMLAGPAMPEAMTGIATPGMRPAPAMPETLAGTAATGMQAGTAMPEIQGETAMPGMLKGTPTPGMRPGTASAWDWPVTETPAERPVLGPPAPGRPDAALPVLGLPSAGLPSGLSSPVLPGHGRAAARAGRTDALTAAGLVPYPVVPARTLLSLREGQFVLAASDPGPPRADISRVVPARLPSGNAPEAGAAEPDAGPVPPETARRRW